MLTRREAFGMALAALAPCEASAAAGAHQATGVKAGEITPASARIWVRRTKLSGRREDGVMPLRGGVRARTIPLPVDTGALHGSCPGEEGEMRVLVRTAAGRKVHETGWMGVTAHTDFTHQFTIGGLRPATAYVYEVESRAGRRRDGSLTGVFRTAPEEGAVTPISLAMLSCQKYSQRDDGRGFFVYDAIRQWKPAFYLSVGDNVYYDSDDPVVNHTSMARFHWQRMFSLPRTVDCLRAVPGYWVKDDHDSYSDDCYPGMMDEKMKPFTFEEGLRVYPEQIPIGPKPYRSFRWGRGVEVWLLEGRDYRDRNRAPDGPKKTIWGAEQKKWLQDSLLASKADWKLIVSPTPVVGPDRPTKHDNHSNDVFAAEGVEFKQWLSKNLPHDTLLLCGDRHWQYHSIDPDTRVKEFCCGAASDAHAGGTPGEDSRLHKFHRVKGGFLAIQARPERGRSTLVVEHRDVHGQVVFAQNYEKKL